MKFSKLISILVVEAFIVTFFIAYVAPALYLMAYTIYSDQYTDGDIASGLSVVVVLIMLVFLGRVGYLAKKVDVSPPVRKGAGDHADEFI